MGFLRNTALRLALLGLRPQTKQSEVGTLISKQVHGRAAPRLDRAEDFAREGYQNNVIAYRCIKEIAQAAASVPITLFAGDDELDMEQPRWRVLRRPNPFQSWAAWTTAALSYLQIAGDSYLEAVAPTAAPPREMYTLRPDRTTIVPGDNGMPRRYVYTVNQDSKPFEVDPVTGDSDCRHLKLFNPLDDWYGMSPIKAAAVGINQFNEAGIWNQNLLLRGASRGIALELQAQDGHYDVLSDADYDTLTKRLEEQFTGSRNVGRPKIFEGGLKAADISFSPQDMDWLNGKHTSARDVCSAFSFPCQLLGIPGDNTYSNYREARHALFENTVMPYLNFLLDELNVWLLPRFGDGLRLEADEDAVPALAPRRESLWDRVSSADFLTPQEKRAAVGWDRWEPNDDPANQLTQPANELPLGFEPEDVAEFEKGLREDGVPEATITELKRLAFGTPNGEWRLDA